MERNISLKSTYRSGKVTDINMRTQSQTNMSLSIRQIEGFRAVMICGTTRAAAEMLHVSQPVVSKLIVQMETRLGYSLFDRKGNAIIPNEAAHRLFNEANQLQERVEQFSRFARTLKQSESGSLTIYTSATFSTTLVPRILAEFHALHPNVAIRVENQTVNEIGQKLLANPDSLGITVWPVNDPNITCETLASRPVRVLMRKDHHLAQSECPLTLQTLQGESLILHSNSMPLGDAIRLRMAQFDHVWRVPFTVDNSETAYSLVDQGLGVFLCDPFASISLNAHNLISKDIETGVYTSVCALRSKFQTDHPQVMAFTTLLRAHLNRE